jgi:deazaflavin-dependent oxidoreductase (nitroreductase family)
MRVSSLLRRLGRTRWFARLGRAVSTLDRRLQKVSRGRWTVLGRSSLPQLILTTTGRRSGEPREAVLLYAVDGDGWVLIGSNWGQEHHPAWSGNLLADPHATVTIAGVTTPVVATLADDDERARLLPALLDVWPAYEVYAARSGRQLRVFRLAPARVSG